MVNKHDDETNELEEITDEDTVPEDLDAEDIESLEEDKLKSLKEKNKRLEEEKLKAQEELALSKADFLNGKRRLEEEKQRGIERQKIKGVEALLPLCDSFYMAMADKEAWEAIDANWRKGIEGIHANLQSILKEQSVEEFDPIGEIFNPELHEAISTMESDSETETIIETMQLGYKIGDNIIRHAKVIISN